jgi:glucokinase
MRVLAGDIGGTKTLLALVDCVSSRCTLIHKARYASADFTELGTMVATFLRESGEPKPHQACFAVAGPVSDQGRRQTAQLTNLPWKLNSISLIQALGIPKVRLLNDLQSVGFGIAGLEEQDLVTLQSGSPEPGEPKAILGSGTGLGQAVLFWRDNRYAALPSEGGHTDFAPQDAVQMELLSELRQEFGHVSYERLVSGPGLARIYWFLQRHSGETTKEEFFEQGSDVASVISKMALEGSNPIALQALELFVEIYGAQAGNLALTVLARGGVYLAGGIAPKIMPMLMDGSFVTAFNDKGRMASVMRKMPVHVINNPETGLLGAALAASRL